MIDDHIIMLESAKYANKFLVEEPNIRAIFRTSFYDGAKWAIETIENMPPPPKSMEDPVFYISQEDNDSCTIKDCEHNEPETISEIVPHPEKFNPKTQPCVLTNQGIITDIIKFD